MKKLTKISLHTLSQAELQKRELNAIRGGENRCPCTSTCECSYAGDKEGPNDSYYGGSSEAVNGSTNSNNAMESTRKANNPSI